MNEYRAHDRSDDDLEVLVPGFSEPEIVSFWTASNITVIVSLLGAFTGIATVTVGGIKAWFEERSSRSISIKDGDRELVITGRMSEKQIDDAIRRFSDMRHGVIKTAELQIEETDQS